MPRSCVMKTNEAIFLDSLINKGFSTLLSLGNAFNKYITIKSTAKLLILILSGNIK